MGSHLARMLSGNGHDITVIDSDAKALDELGSFADLITVEGDTTAFAVLRKAGVRRCDLFSPTTRRCSSAWASTTCSTPRRWLRWR